MVNDPFGLKLKKKNRFLAVFGGEIECAAFSRPHFLTYAIQLDYFVAALLAMTAC
jgi:hypothetical protein